MDKKLNPYISEYQNVFDPKILDEMLALKYKQCPDINADFVLLKDDLKVGWEKYFEYIEKTSLELVKQYLKRTYSKLPVSALSLNHIGFKTDTVGAFTELHYDWEMDRIKDKWLIKPLVALVYLTDVEEGGGCLFPVEGITVEPKKGKVVVFPCCFAFPHVTNPVMKGIKEVIRLTFRMDHSYYQSQAIEF